MPCPLLFSVIRFAHVLLRPADAELHTVQSGRSTCAASSSPLTQLVATPGPRGLSVGVILIPYFVEAHHRGHSHPTQSVKWG